MSKLFYTSSAQPLRLGSALGTGGAGTVYEVKDTPSLVAKLYHEPLTSDRAEKLTLLARLGNERLFKLTAWPTDVLRTQPGGPITGFTMQRVGQAEEVHALHSPKSRLQKFPDASWAFLLYVAANIARAVAIVHEHGFIIGDLNPKNILVTRQATVYLLDCDSFQIEAEGRIWRCEQGFPEYTPPELQGVAFRDVDRTAAHDAFGLAVVIFQLLFLGRHPFSGKFMGAGELPLERAIRELRFAYGHDAASRQMQQPPGTLALEAVSEPVAALFQRAFLTNERPQPREWIEALETLAQSIQRCVAHSGHQFYQELSACPWCEIEQRARTRLFNFALNGQPKTQSHFRLDKIWAEIENVEPPLVPPLPVRQALVLQPSEDAVATARKRRAKYILALLFALVAGWGSAALFKMALAVPLLIVAAKLAQLIAEAEPDMPWVTRTSFWQQPINPSSPYVREFVQRREDAEVEYRHLSERWQQEATDHSFRAKLGKLTECRDAYEALPHHPSQWLSQYEARVKAEQMNHYLTQFELGQDSTEQNFIRYLSEGGIHTAADVTPQKLSRAVLVNHEQAQTLLAWRRKLEQRFVFDAGQAVPPTVCRQLEQEWQTKRLHLERKLNQGAERLRRFQAEAHAKQLALHEPLLMAQTKLAQAERDYELVAERNPRVPLIVLLILSFLFGSLWTITRPDIQPSAPPLIIEPKTRVPLNESSSEATTKQVAADKLYNQAHGLSQSKLYRQAIPLYVRAVELDSRLAAGWQELAYAYYQTGQYREAVRIAGESLRVAQSFQAYYVLGLAYEEQKYWALAEQSYESAVRIDWGEVPKADYWRAQYGLAYSLAQLNEASGEMEILRQLLMNKPTLVEERFQLAALYGITGQRKAAREQLSLLAKQDAVAATLLRGYLKPPPPARIRD